MTVQDRNDPPDFVSSNVLGAAELNQIPRGCIWSDEGAANVGPTATTATILSGTFHLDGDDRRIRFTASTTGTSDIPGGIYAAIYVDGTQRQRRNDNALGGGKRISWTVIKDVQLDSGDHTVEFIIGVDGAAGNEATALADGQTGNIGVHSLYVDDVSPSLL